MAYTTINKSTDHVNTKLYTGNNSTNAITGVGHQPDMVWIKRRNNTSDHQVYDAVRGAQKGIFTSTTGAEATEGSTRGLNAFNSDGFTLGAEVSDIAGSCNANSDTYASWNWKAGTTSGLSGGTITPSAYSINTTSKFGIYKYSGTGSTGTIAHGLGATPTFMIFKKLDGSQGWHVYHKDMGATHEIYLNDTAAKNDVDTAFNDTSPTSTVFTIGTSNGMNSSGHDYIAYVWCDVAGYCKAGSYTGNGSSTSAPFIYCGFKPKFLLGKRTDGAGQNWFLIDTDRQEYNNRGNVVYPDATTAEGTTYYIDLLSNGWRWNVDGAGENGSGNSYIFMAIGQTMVGTNNVPACGR